MHTCILSKNIIVYCDDKVEERYLSLDDLGIVLEKLSHQLPGMYSAIICMCFRILCTCMCIIICLGTVKIKRTFNGELRPGCPNLILTPHSMYNLHVHIRKVEGFSINQLSTR